MLNERFDKLISFKENEMKLRSSGINEAGESKNLETSAPAQIYRTPNILNIKPNSKLDLYNNYQ